MDSGKGESMHAMWLAALLGAVLGLCLLIYWPGLDGPFVLDDPGNLGPMEATEFAVDQIHYDITHNASGRFGRPVSMLSLVFTRIVHGPGTWGFKYHNLLLHMLNGLLLFWLLLKLLPELAPGQEARKLLLVAGSAATLWLLHPLMVSTVLYAVQRMAQLAALFTLAALLAYVALRKAMEQARPLRFQVLAVLLYALFQLLALLSKENGALIPVYVILIELVVYRFRADTPAQRRVLGLFHGVFVLAPLLLGSLYLLANFDRFSSYAFRDFTMGERVLTQAHVLLFYVKLVLLPAVSDMSLFHDGWAPVRSPNVLTLLLLLFWCAVAASVLWFRTRAPVVALGIGWFLVSHLLESTIFDLELVFEHRNYLAAAGLLLIPLYYVITSSASYKGLLLPAIALPLFLLMTHSRVAEWDSDDMLYGMAVQDHPDSIRAQTAYSSLRYIRGDVETALRHAQLAIALDEREYGNLFLNILILCGRNSQAQIDALLDEATRIAGLYPSTPHSFAALDRISVQIQQGRCPELAIPRIQQLLEAARRQPDNVANLEYTGFLQRQQGIYYYIQGNLQAGYEHMVLAYENTGLASILVELIDIEAHLGALETVENLLAILEQRNSELYGSETVLVEKARLLVQQAREIRTSPRSGPVR